MASPRLSLALAGALAIGTLTALVPSSAAAGPPPDKAGKDSVLSSRLQELNAEPEMTTAETAEETDTPPDGPGSLLKYDAERYLVDIRVDELTQDVVDELAAAGATITHENPELNLVTAGVKPERFDEVAHVDGVEYVADILTPITHATCPSGIVSEGDGILKAVNARANTGIDGTGVNVGILSDSYDRRTGAPTRAVNDIASGDLPGAANPCGHLTPVNVLADNNVEADEGRAMAQIVHDVAPGANLSFATAFGGESAMQSEIENFAENIGDVSSAGADVIVDDITYFEEPFYQPGILDNAVTAATNAGALYVSSAGNSNVKLGGEDVGSYETLAYRPMSCPTINVSGGPAPGLINCHDFDPGTGEDEDFDFRLKSGRAFTLDLQWAEPHFGVTRDIDVYLLSGNQAVAKSIDSNPTTPGDSGSQKPLEILSYENNSGAAQDLRLVIGHYTGQDPGTPYPRMKFIFVGDDEYMFESIQSTSSPDVRGPTIFGHNGGEHTVSVAASDYATCAATCPVQDYSSRGPVTHLFGPVDGVDAADPIAPTTYDKPDLTAVDCTQNTFFGSASVPHRFCGTSAAAPHAAAVAALLRGLRPGATPTQVKAALIATADDDPAVGKFVEGAGLVDADAARAQAAFVALPKSNQTIVFDAPGAGTAGGTAVLNATASSGLPVTFTVAGGSAGVCSIAGQTVNYLAAGTCTINAGQGGNAGYNPAPQVADSITVAAAPAPPPPPPPPPPTPPPPAPPAVPSGSCGGRRATIVGTNGSDTIRGTNGNDVIDAKGGNDTINGRGGNDIICGGGGNDRIDGGGGKDRLNGGSGRDTLNGGAGKDACSGGPGRDRQSSC